MQGIDIVFSIAVLIMSVVAHEVAHGYAALYLGDPTARLSGRLTLNPLKHLDFIGSFVVPLVAVIAGLPVFGWAKPVPYNPYNLRRGKWGPAIVAAAGPLTNFSIAITFGIVIRIILSTGASGALAPLVGIISIVVLVNLVLGTFNLIPIPPLDGSKVLFALLPPAYDHVRVFLERYGFIILLFFIFFLSSVLLPVVTTLFALVTGIGSAW